MDGTRAVKMSELSPLKPPNDFNGMQFAFQPAPVPTYLLRTSARKSVGGVMDDHANELDAIKEALKGLMFGSVNIIVQDGVIIQIDRTEKRRLRSRTGKQAPGQEADLPPK